jgi:hypothetical protein
MKVALDKAWWIRKGTAQKAAKPDWQATNASSPPSAKWPGQYHSRLCSHGASHKGPFGRATRTPARRQQKEKMTSSTDKRTKPMFGSDRRELMGTAPCHVCKTKHKLTRPADSATLTRYCHYFGKRISRGLAGRCMCRWRTSVQRAAR